MTFPYGARLRTYAAAQQVRSADLNAIQDALIALSHGFEDHFRYPGSTTQLLHPAGYGTTRLDSFPWGFRALTGALGLTDNRAIMLSDELDGVVRLCAKNAANEGIEMFSGGIFTSTVDIFSGWFDASVVGTKLRIRFRTPASLADDIWFGCGFMHAGAWTNGYVKAWFNGSTGKLQASCMGSGSAGTTVDIAASLAVSTWYELTCVVKNSTTVTWSLNGATGVDASVAAADALVSQGYDLCAQLVQPPTPSTDKNWDIDRYGAVQGA
jgi:hypothetical protein